MAIENKNFIGGLNSDTEDRLVPNGDYRYALNCRLSKSDGSNEGTVENTKGNNIVSVSLPLGTNKVIGAYDNIETNKVYYFLFNSRGNHTIYEFDANSNSISIVLKSRQLNFKSNKFIDDPTMIDDLLFFNDRENPPRRINVDRAKSNSYPSPFKTSYIDLPVSAPGCPPTAVYGNSSDASVADRKTNNVRNKLFQFRYKFIYLDNEESAWSPISKVPLPINEGSFRPFQYYPTEINNVINVEVETGDSFVKAIKIAVREGSDDFFLATELDKKALNITTPTYTYEFLNDEIYTSIDNNGNDGLRLFDSAPQKADSQALIDGNRIAYGGVTENYDPVDIDIDIEVNREISPEVEAPVVDEILRIDRWNGFGSNNPLTPPFNISLDPDWVYVTSNQGNYGRNINGQTYYFFAGRAASRPSPIPSSWKGTFTTSTNPNILNPSFSKPVNSYSDRVLLMRPISSTADPITVTESTLNEFYISAPNAVGTRYVARISVNFFDYGETNEYKTRTFRAQHTSVAGDTAATVAASLVQKIQALGTVADGQVEIDWDRTDTATTSYSDSSFNGNQIIRVWTRAVVPSANKTDIPGSFFPTAVGPDTAALYGTTCYIDSYADWTSRSDKCLKAGANHGIGIVYSDGPNRSGLTNIDVQQKTFYVPFFTEQNIPSGSIPNETSLTVTINHQPPEWADRYQFVYTGNQTIETIPGTESAYKGFLQFKLADYNVTTPGSSSSVTATLANLNNYNNTIPEATDLQYSFTKGDRIRFITDLNGDYYNTYADVEMISYDSSTNTIEFKNPNIITIGDGVLVEVYTPKKTREDLVYYEIGECYNIVNGLHQGTTNQTSTSPATVLLQDIGDIYLRFRVVPINSIVESYSYSDYYDSDYWDKGRPNIVDNNIQRVKRESTIRYSQPYLPDTNINGLSTFFDFSFEDYDQQYGSILKMHPEDKDLIVMQRLKIGKVRIGQETLYSNEGTQVATVKSQNTVLSDIVYYSGEFGIGNNPESFAVYGNRKYFTDVPRGAVLRLSTDGITPIEKIFMHNYFNDTFKRLVDSSGDFRVIGAYDVRFDEYRISIQENVEDIPLEIVRPGFEPIVTDPSGNQDSDYTSGPSRVPSIFESSFVDDSGDSDANLRISTPTVIVEPEVTDFLYETIAFSESKKRWTTFYSYIPDYMVSNNISFISFKNGQLYKHNDSDLYNNFYGEQFVQQVKLVANAGPNQIKFYNNIFTESTSPFSMPEATNQFGQKTSLIEADFFDDEGVFKAALLRDENTPNIENPLIEGDDMRCHSMVILLQNSETGLVKLFNVGVGQIPSQLTGR